MAQDISVGIINEIGDMGLGFRELDPKDNKIVNEANKNQTPQTTVINEENK